MKIIISNFIEHFYEWKNKIENQRNPYLTQILNDIKHVLEDPNANHNNKAATLVNIIQNIPFEYIPFLFDYSTAELKMISGGDGTLLKDEAISVSLYNDFIGDLANSEYLDSESDTEKVLLTNYTYTEDDSDYQSSISQKTLENINDSDNNIDVIMKILDENSLENISDTFVDAYYHDANTEFDGNIIFMIVSSYILYYVEDEGWGYKEYNESWENIFEVVDNVFENEQPEVDLDFTQYLLSKIDFNNYDDYYKLYAVVYEYDKNQNTNVSQKALETINDENIEFNNDVVSENSLSKILSVSSRVYITGLNIVDKLYDLNNTEVDLELFPKDYPWNESFDDVVNQLIYYFNLTYSSLVDKFGQDSKKLNQIILIDNINAINKESASTAENKNLNQLFSEFKQALKKLYIIILNDNYNYENDWFKIYKNADFKQLLEVLKYSFNYNDIKIKKYLDTQSKIDYSKFSEEN